MTMPTFSAGQSLTGAQLELLARQIDSLTAPGWIDYTVSAPTGGSVFALTASTSNPTQGNSTYVAQYRRPASSDLVFVRMKLSFGSTFAVGSGTYRFGLPFTADASSIDIMSGFCQINDSGVALRTGFCKIAATTYATAHYLNSTTNATFSDIINVQPGPATSWGTSDWLALHFSYAAA